MAPSIPETCRAAVIEEFGKPLVVKQVPVKQPKQGEILVKVEACGVCHSDSGASQGHFGEMVKLPLIPGHELIGHVVKLGPGETKWKEGDRVGGPWHGGHDGTCKQCSRGVFQTCANEEVNGITRDGGYSEYVVLRTEAAVSIPDDVDAAAYAPLLCAGVTVFNGIRHMGLVAGDIIVVQGLGGLGHLAIQYARKLGYRTVAMSRDASKKGFAMELGATDYVDTSKEDPAEAVQKMGGAALVLITAPTPEVVGKAINACAPGGKVLMLAPVGEVSINTVPLIIKNISVHGWPSGHALDSEEAIAFARLQNVNCMVEKFPLEKVNEAMDHMMHGKVRFRGVLVME